MDIYTQSKVPHVIFAGKQDNIVNINDVREVVDQFKNVEAYYEIEGEHMSFLIGKDYSFVDSMIQHLNKANNISN